MKEKDKSVIKAINELLSAAITADKLVSERAKEVGFFSKHGEMYSNLADEMRHVYCRICDSYNDIMKDFGEPQCI